MSRLVSTVLYNIQCTVYYTVCERLLHATAGIYCPVCIIYCTVYIYAVCERLLLVSTVEWIRYGNVRLTLACRIHT